MAISSIEEQGYMFKFLNKAWNVLTWGYISEILFAIFIFIIIVITLLLLTEHKIMRYLFKDRMFFVKNYLYFFLSEKKNFIKSFLYLIKTEIKHYWVYILILIGAGVLMGFIIYFTFQLSKG